jgi:hypothetical protein
MPTNTPPKFETMKLWASTRTALRKLFALTGKSMASIADEVIKKELEKIERKEQEKK